MTIQSVKSIFSTTPGHDEVVDAVRAIAVLATIIFHIFAGFLKVWDTSFTHDFLSGMGWWIAPLFQAEKGVDAFFLLSGLVLGLPLFQKLNSFNVIQAKTFYWRRFTRIYPLFLVALLFYHFLRKGDFNSEFFSNLFFINNFSKKWDPIIPVGWSLTIEVQLYLLVPFYFFLIKRVNRPQWIMGITILLSFFITAWTLISYPELINRPISDLLLASDRDHFGAVYGKNIYETFANRFAPFVIGLWLAYLKVNYSKHLERLMGNKIWGNFLILTGFFLVGVVIFMPVYDLEGWYVKNFSPQIHFLYQVFSRQFFSMGLAIVMLAAWHGRGVGAFLRLIAQWPFWAPFSKLAYPLYLFHYPCIVISALLVFRSTDLKVLQSVNLVQAFMVFVLSCVISVCLSIPLHFYIEKKFMNYKRSS